MSEETVVAPVVVEDLALAMFRMVKDKLAFELDFTPDTLPVLDHFLIELRGERDEKAVAVVAPCAGAYFGEVVRRALPDLRWSCGGDDYPRWRLEGERAFLCFNPIGAALEAIHRCPLEGWNAHLTLLPTEAEIVGSSLAGAGPIREDDFYRLAVRYEVLEQTLSVLHELARRKAPPPTFGPEVYAALEGAKAAIEA